MHQCLEPFTSYFDLDGNPIIVVSERTFPQILRSGKWEIVDDYKRFFTEADRIHKAEFDQMVGDRRDWRIQ